MIRDKNQSTIMIKQQPPSLPWLNLVTTSILLLCCDGRTHAFQHHSPLRYSFKGKRKQQLPPLLVRVPPLPLSSPSSSSLSNTHYQKSLLSKPNPLPTVGETRMTSTCTSTLSSSSLCSFSSLSSSSSESEEKKISKRKRFLNMIALKHLRGRGSNKNHKQATSNSRGEKEKESIEVKTVQELEDYFNDVNHNFRKKKKKNGDDIDYDKLLASLVVKGDTQKIGSTTISSNSDLSSNYFLHNVQQILHNRRRNLGTSSTNLTNNNNNNTISSTTPIPISQDNDNHNDNHKIALVIEGGGMRGCVTAGMVTAIYYLGLEDTFDIIYGSSAGTIIGAYFNTRQLPFFGPEIYYDSLTTAGKKFIDTKRLLRCIGLGLVDPRLLRDVLTRPKYGKPVLNLDFLLRETMQLRKPLNWNKFVEMQTSTGTNRSEKNEGKDETKITKKGQPLKVVSSGLHCGHSVVLDYENGGFDSIQELASAMRSSCLLPGIAGPIMNVQKAHVRNSKKAHEKPKYIVGNDIASLDNDYEPLADALIYEPLPYKTAIAEGATHVVMLRSRPDGADVTGKTSIFEKMILHRFFNRKNKLSRVYKYMRRHGHKKLYAKQVLELNEASNDANSNIMAIALPPGSPEITKLETGRKEIFEGVRRGFARAYDCLVEDPRERGRGEIIAKQYLPDEILEYDPLLIDSGDLSAFEYFLNEKERSQMPSCSR